MRSKIDKKALYLDGYKLAIPSWKLKIRISSLGLANVVPLATDATKGLPVPDSTVSAFLLIKVFHGFLMNDELDSLVLEMRRTMKPGGRVAVVEKENRWASPDMEDHSKGDVEKIMQGYGFTLELKRDISNEHVLGIFRG